MLHSKNSRSRTQGWRQAFFVSTVLSLIVTLPAAAQSVAPKSAADQPAGQSTTASTLEEVIVTAARRSENIQKSSLAVAAISGQDLVKAGLTQPKGLTTLEPGVTVSTAGSNTQIYIRGVGNFTDNILANPAVAVNLDQVYLARPAAVNAIFYDIDRVEILKGPQGTLYGRNASGGAINVITNNPSLTGYGGFGSLEAGNYGLVDAEGALNVPLSDKLAVRGAFQGISRNGYLSDGSDDDRQQAGRLKVLFQPTDRLSIVLSTDYAHVGGKGAGAVLTPFVDPSNPWVSDTDPRARAVVNNTPTGQLSLLVFHQPFAPLLNNQFQRDTFWGVSADVEADLGWGRFTLIPAYRDTRQEFLTNAFGSPSYDKGRSHEGTVEARLSNDVGRLKWVGGLYFFNEDQSGIFMQNSLPLIQATLPFPRINDRSYAAFGQATFSLSSRLRVIGGLRYTDEPTYIVGSLSTFSFGVQHAPVSLSNETSFNNISWKAGLEYDIAPESMAYFTASSGFKSGGFFFGISPGNTFQPETLTAYELGIKNRFFDDRLQLNIEAFHWDYFNHQESHLSPGLFGAYQLAITNAGRATIQGADVSLRYRLTPRDTLSAAVEYNDAHYNSFDYELGVPAAPASPATNGCVISPVFVDSRFMENAQNVNCAGKQVARAPAWTINAGLDHVFDLSSGGTLDASLATRFSSSYWTAVDFVPAERQGDYTLTNFDLTYAPAQGRWRLTGYVHNLESSAVKTDGFPSASIPNLIYSTLLAPRTFGGRFVVEY